MPILLIRTSILASFLMGLFVAVASAQGAALAAAVSSDAPAFYEDALKRFDRGDFEATIIQLKNAVQRDPRNPAAHLLMGKTYLKLGEGALAEKELIRARRLGAHRNLILVPMGKAYLAQRKFDQLLDQVRPGRRDNATETEVLILRGTAHLELREYEKAEKDFAAAARRRPNYGVPLTSLASVDLEQGKLDEAEELTDRALRIDRKIVDPWYLKAEIRRIRHDPAEALKFYEKAIELEPRHTLSLIGRASVLVDLKRDDEALKDILVVRAKLPRDPQAAFLHALILTRANKINEAQAVLAEAAHSLKNRDAEFVRNHTPSLLLLGVINYAQKNYDEAYQYLSRFNELAPYHPGARKLLGSILLRNGQNWAAVNMLQPALRQSPKDAELFALLGSAYSRVGQHSDATKMFEKAADLAPDRARVRTQLALSRLATGQQLEALEDFQKAFALETDGNKAGTLLGLLYIRRGEFDKALETAKTMITRDPKNPVGYNLAAAARLRQGKREEARKGFQRAVDIDPDYLAAYFNLASMDLHDGDVGAAEKQYHAILNRKPINVEAMEALAKLALKQDRIDVAVEWLKKIATLDPDAIKQQALLARLYLRLNRLDLAGNLVHDLEARHPWSTVALEIAGRVQLAAGKPEAAARRFTHMTEILNDSAVGLLKVADLQVRAFDVDGARKSLIRAIELDPNLIPAHIALIRLEAREKNVETALGLARALQAAHPESRDADVVTGELLMRIDRFEEAAAAYTAALNKEKSSPIVRRLYEAQFRSGKRADALALLEDWVKSEPKDIRSQRLLGSAYLNAGRLQDAIAQNERLLAGLPDDAVLLNNLAGLYHKTGDPRALTYAEKAYKIAPQQAAILDTYGWILVEKGEPAKGLNLLRQANTRAANKPEVLYHIAVALERLGRTEEARQELGKALEISDQFFGAAEARALLSRISGG